MTSIHGPTAVKLLICVQCVANSFPTPSWKRKNPFVFEVKGLHMQIVNFQP